MNFVLSSNSDISTDEESTNVGRSFAVQPTIQKPASLSESDDTSASLVHPLDKMCNIDQVDEISKYETSIADKRLADMISSSSENLTCNSSGRRFNCERENISPKPLELLPCSESIIENREETKIERLTSTPKDNKILMPIVISAKSLLPGHDNSMSSSDDKINTEELMNVLYGTVENDNITMNTKDAELNSNAMKYLKDTWSMTLSDASVNQYVTVSNDVDNINDLDPTNSQCEVSIDEFLSANRIRSVSSSLSETLASNVMPEGDLTFDGFMPDNPCIAKNSKAIEILDRVNPVSNKNKEETKSKLGNNQFIREIWKKKYLNSETRYRTNCSLSDSELLDSIPTMNLDSTSSTPGIVTRSKGKPQIYPLVQDRPIEYKSKKNRRDAVRKNFSD